MSTGKVELAVAIEEPLKSKIADENENLKDLKEDNEEKISMLSIPNDNLKHQLQNTLALYFFTQYCHKDFLFCFCAIFLVFLMYHV